MKHDVKFIEEWNAKQQSAVHKIILSYLKSRVFYSRKSEGKSLFEGCRTYNDIDSKIGLTYTSSSSCAGLWVCSDEVYIDLECNFVIKGFVISENDIVHVYCTDKDENELTYPIN